MAKKIILFALAVFLLVPVFSQTASARSCHKYVYAGLGEWKNTKVFARQSAISTWRAKTGDYLGPEYKNWRFAKNKKVVCWKSKRIGVLGRKDRCIVRAKPCM